MKKLILMAALFHKGDTVMQVKSKQLYIIDSIQVQTKHQVLYSCHDLNGIKWPHLPQLFIIAKK